MSRSDPITSYYKIANAIDSIINLLFFLSASLSLFIVLADENFGIVTDEAAIIFLVSTLILFFMNIVLGFYLFPRAEDARRSDFFTSALGISLTHKVSNGYYNTEEKEPALRTALQLLENTFFTKNIAHTMRDRIFLITIVYLAIWLYFVFSREASIDLIVALTQLLLAEQLLAKLIKIEWLHRRTENIYSSMYSLLQNRSSEEIFSAYTLDYLVKYESVKLAAGVLLSGSIFRSRNEKLSAEWSDVKTALGYD